MDLKIIFPDIDLAGVKAVLIDLDNTLYQYEPCHKYALQICFENFPDAKISFQDFADLYKKHRDQVTKLLLPQGACRSRFFAFLHLFEELKISQAYVKALQFDEIYWDRFISAMKLDENAKNFLDLCKNKNLPICVVTDMLATTQVRKIQKLQLENIVDFLVTSEEVGFEKPNPIIFAAALKKLNLTKSDVIMIGDDENKDVEGARKFGITSYQIQIG